MPPVRRALLSLLAGVAVLAAGCAEPAREVPAAELASTAPTPAAGAQVHASDGRPLLVDAGGPPARGVQLFHGAVSYEPTLGLDASGALFMTADARGIVTAAPTILKSADKGLTWEDAGPRLPTGHPRHPLTFDPYVHVDRATGRVFMDDIVPLGCGTLSFSDDQGKTWTTNPLACGNPQANDHQTLVTGKPRVVPTVGYPNVVYRCVNNLAYSSCAMSYNGGLTFTPQTVVADVVRMDDCGITTGALETDPEGRVFLPFGLCAKGPRVAVSEDDGLTWQVHAIAPDHPLDGTEHDVSVASDEAGNLFALWQHKGQAWMSHSVDHGRAWSPPRNVTAPGVTAVAFLALDAAGPGKVALTYYGTTAEGGYEARHIPTDILQFDEPSGWENVTWNAYLAVLEDALGDDPAILTALLHDPADPVARGTCGGTRCHGVGDFVDLEIDAEGRPWAALVDVCNAACVRDPKVVHDEPAGFVGTLEAGPSLLAAGGALPPLRLPGAATPARGG